MAVGTYGYQQCFEEPVSTITATNSVALGTRRLVGGNEYIYCYNAGATTASVGYGVIQSLNSQFSVTVSAALGDVCFGVVRNTDLLGSYYGWICVKGPATAQFGNTATGNHTAATGDPIYVGANGAFEACTTGATGSTWAARACGHTLQTIATASAGVCYFWGR